MDRTLRVYSNKPGQQILIFEALNELRSYILLDYPESTSTSSKPLACPFSFMDAKAGSLAKSTLNSFATNCYRIMLGIKRIDIVSNEIVYNKLILQVQQR
jgi:hypothetical protein